ncbi:Histone acetyltransferase GCN5 [Lamellibrachia satsuma]|nr:Histone acetyltransferase GCN5 [Lamellibrachia satsuma]
MNRRGFQYREECFSVLNAVYNHEMSFPFRAEVRSTEVPDYYKVIKFPMCLDLIASRLRQRLYTDVEHFVSDMRRIFWNCKLYHQPNSPLYRHGEIVERFCNWKLRETFKECDFSHITGSPKFTTTQGATKFTTTKGATKSEKLSVKKAKIPGELRPLLG